MSSIIDNESEILLGNKQLLVVFAVVAVLLAVAFTGGYMLGKNNEEKKIPSAVAAEGTTATVDAGGVVTGAVPPAGSIPEPGELKATVNPNDDAANMTAPYVAPASEAKPDAKVKRDVKQDAPLPLGARKSKPPAGPEAISGAQASAVAEAFAPQTGQTFLQVAAVGRDEADAVADVLHKKGFRAHSVPKPGNAKIYRVLIGPINDTGDLAATRDSLRKTGFREVITQKY